jgi:hypothetical protein
MHFLPKDTVRRRIKNLQRYAKSRGIWVSAIGLFNHSLKTKTFVLGVGGWPRQKRHQQNEMKETQALTGIFKDSPKLPAGYLHVYPSEFAGISTDNFFLLWRF